MQPLPQFTRRLITGCLAAASLLATAEAATLVSGDVSGTWTTAGSPYKIIDNCTVSAGKKLILQPGASVVFSQGRKLIINGSIWAVGTASNRISFASISTNFTWGGIDLNWSSAPSAFTACDFSGAATSVSLTMPGQQAQTTTWAVPFVECYFDACATRAIQAASVGWAGWIGGPTGGWVAFNPTLRLELTGCTFTSSPSGVQLNTDGVAKRDYDRTIRGEGKIALLTKRCEFRGLSQQAVTAANTDLSGASSISILNSTFAVCGTALDAQATYTVRTANCVVFQCVNGFVSTTSGAFDVENCIFEDCSTALQRLGGSTSIAEHNCFHRNAKDFTGYPSSYGTVIANNINGSPCDVAMNIFLDPKFANTNTFVIDGASPCIDAGNQASSFNDVLFPPSLGTAINDMGAYGGPGASQTVGVPASDKDLDGLPDAWELQYFGNLNMGPNEDPDGDGLTNAQEFDLGTDPGKKDTDGDGYSDYAEVRAHSNPLDPASVPPPVLNLMVETVAVEFTAPVGQTNRVMASANLTDWSLVEELVGTGDLIHKSYTVTNEARFFKLVKP